ncbi:hypothetical protein BAS06_04350 [Elizabethkingia miricola]|uniref:DUF262 domain-containing protein n=1 Tax=Elizabethkingia miricola TaxID=172045 RepID=UPI00099A4BE5|nr:DUF262 domain-containing protein [Elizabethkingia miricola]OPB89595.1 hypothetical protein BAS06_04350 [Elizabethkingia miricola]
MKSQQLKEQSILFLLSQNNFIVPEIQREYVWGNNPDVLDRFLDSIIDKIGNVCDTCGTPKTSSKINVGFLYTYKPSYVNYNYERFLDENLIDGQQRFTSLFLLLFYCALKENRVDNFRDAIRYNELNEIAFDYKVRNLTHLFILDLISKIDNVEKLDQLLTSKTTWLLKDFNQDITVLSMLKALKLIVLKFKDRKEKYFDFILNNIKFYHFKTEATNQGEELYITMNARGEALSKNEENKAALMFDDSNLFEYGAKWEEWQDFFWKNRDKSNLQSNSDNGLNEFLRWIQIIEMTLCDNELNTDEDEKIDEKSLTKKIVILIQGEKIHLSREYFSIEKIEKYFKAVHYIFNEYYSDADILEKYSSVSSNLIKREWLSPKDKIISQIDSFRFIPVLYYVYRLQDENRVIKNQEIFRLLKYLNNLRRDTTVAKTINKQVINTIKLIDNLLDINTDIAKIIELDGNLVSKTLLTPEERFKFSIYLETSHRENFESMFWKVEDNKIFKGKISPLLQFSYHYHAPEDFKYSKNFEGLSVSEIDLELFSKIYENFKIITEENENKLSDDIWASMLLTDYYSVRNYNDNHKIVNCESIEDFNLLRSKFFLSSLKEVERFTSAKDYFQNIFNSFINNYNLLDDLGKEDDLKKQLYIYYIALKNNNNWDYWKGKNFGVYLNPKKFNSFFDINVRFQHYKQKWAGADYNYFNDDKKQLIKFYKSLFNN